jgi:archaellum biogenesis ATPase FlaH
LKKFLSAWSKNGNQTVVCIDSLTTLLQYDDTEQAFQFVHTLMSRFKAVDGTLHAHIHSEAHEAQTLATLGISLMQ